MRIIGGKFRGRKLTELAETSVRPTSDRLRESIFNILAHGDLSEPRGKRVGDIFAGTGALGLEALSRGAAHVIFVEKHQQSLATLRANIKLLGSEDETTVVAASARNLPPALDPCDLIFLDPPYGKRLAEPALDCLYESGWIRPSTVIVIEVGRSEDIALPDWLKKVDERRYGKTKILITEAVLAAAK